MYYRWNLFETDFKQKLPIVSQFGYCHQGVHPRKLTWNLSKITINWQGYRNHLPNLHFLGSNVNFPGCTNIISGFNNNNNSPTISGYIDRDPDVYSAIESDVMMSHDFPERWEGAPFIPYCLDIVFLRGGFKCFFVFTPIWGRFPFWHSLREGPRLYTRSGASSVHADKGLVCTRGMGLLYVPVCSYSCVFCVLHVCRLSCTGL